MDAVNGFRCVCPTGYEGSVCEQNVDDCRGNPCLNGARCVDAVNDFRCECDVGFEGVLCETNIDDCVSSPCLNGGTCHDLVADYVCQCAPGFFGPRCSDVLLPSINVSAAACRERPCLNGAVCIPLPDNAHFCRCTAGYTGHDCGEVVGTMTPAVPISAPSLTLDSSSTLLQLALIGGLGVGVPLTVVLLTAVVVVAVRRRRRRHERLERSSSAIFINNRHSDNLSTSTSSISNNAVALRQNRANSALMSAAASPPGDCYRDVKAKSVCAVDVDADSDAMCGRADRANGRGKGNAAGCSYIKLTNHQPQHQRHSYDPNIYQQQQQQQQYLLHPSHYHSRHHHSLLSQFAHHNRPPPPLPQPPASSRHHHHHRHSNVCRSAYPDDYDVASCSVVDSLKSSRDDRFCLNVAGGDAGCGYSGCRAHRSDDDVDV